MPPVTVSSYFSSREIRPLLPHQRTGPFIAISRQFGCYGYSLGKRLVEAFAQEDAEDPWCVYNREILERLARHTRSDVELLRQKRLEPGNAVLDFLRGIVGDTLPSGAEVRQRITLILKNLAREGRAILVGQGSTVATAGIPGGLTLRFEAPESWRVEQVCRMMDATEDAARAHMARVDLERAQLRSLYGDCDDHGRAYDLRMDCSRFSLDDVSAVVVLLMRRRGLLGNRGDERAEGGARAAAFRAS